MGMRVEQESTTKYYRLRLDAKPSRETTDRRAGAWGSNKLRAHRGNASSLTISVCTWGGILFSDLALTYAMQRETKAQRAMTARVNPIKTLKGESERLPFRIVITDRMKAIRKRIPSIP